LELGGGETTVPGGSGLVVLAPSGDSIPDRLGGMMERGEKVGKLKLPTGNGGMVDFAPVVYPAGKTAPNYVLHPPRGLKLRPGGPHMLGVEEATTLEKRWERVKVFNRPGKVTRVFWCACAAIDGAKNQMVDVA
jgi:hypothetical protein